MSHYLAGHPDIFMSEESGLKEPWFYCSDFDAPWRIKSEKEYIALFDQAPSNTKYHGEASACYLGSSTAVPEILTSVANARFLVMLRNPVDLVLSLHNEHTKYGYETRDIETAWRLQSNHPSLTRPPGTFLLSDNCFQYGKVALLGKQLHRLYELVDKKQVHWILYEDFQQDPAKAYRDTLAFLELPDDARADFKKLNPSITYRWPSLEKSLRTLRRVRSDFGLPGGLGLHKLINRFNVRPGKRPVDEHFRRELQDFFHNDILLLSNTIDRDLSAWLNA